MQNADLISRTAIINDLRTSISFMRYDGTRMGTHGFLLRTGDVVRLIESQQPVDAVPVVRCHECIHRHSSEFCECRDAMAFCSDGEREPSAAEKFIEEFIKEDTNGQADNG